ncbi:tetratricopeptide repeat protein [Kitasatospora sp. NPDC001540]|uniref:tetratricopeptide repeat protein n=1 Tax=Kitasatospora sp. NPDC001540 TaxID=3364014 RepID=UPI00368DFD18
MAGESAQAQRVLREFGQRLDQLRRDAGNPSGPQLMAADEDRKLTATAISELQKGRSGVFRVYDWDFVSAFVCACRKHDEQNVQVLTAARTDLVEWKISYTRLVTLVEEFDRIGKEENPGTGRGAPAAVSGGPVLPLLAPPPRVPDGFTGRGQELEDLLTLLNPSAGAGREGEQAVVVASVLGMGGMGKTTLGLATAHRALARGVFTGVLFLDLHGYDDNTLDAGQALDSALRALGTEAEQIPPDTDQRAALYRAQLAARTRAGERVLVLADNASTSAQVQQLVPSDGPHRLLVTSRDDFAPSLGARLVDLDVLTPKRAVELMDTALRLTLPKDERIRADPEGAARVAELCGYLPLALQIATAQLVAERGLRPAALAGYLEDIAQRLNWLEDGDRAVRSVLNRSYERLSLPQAELFRLLAVNPGPDVSTKTAVAFTGIGKAKDVRDRLVALSRASLIRQDPDTGRWRMHDLVRAYATEQAARHPAHTAAALHRLLRYYALTAQDADAHVDMRDAREDGLGQRFAGRVEALAWLDAERANLVAAVHTTGHHDIAQNLASYLGPYLHLRRHLESRLEVAEIGLAAARDSRDPAGEAMAWNNLGNALQDLRRFEEADQAYRTALNQFQALDDHYREAIAWNNLGGVLQGLRRFEEAEQAYRTALTQHQALGDHHREAIAWDNLGLVLQDLRRFEEAEQAHRTALNQHQALGDHHREAIAWDNLGSALQKLRRFEEAEQAHRTALNQHQALGDHHREAIACNNLGSALQKLRRFEEAEQAHRTALNQHQALGDHHSEAIAWNNLGTVLRGSGETGLAVEAGERAVALFEELKDQYRLGEALDELADSLLATGRPANEVRAVREQSAAAYRRADAEDEAVKVLEKTDE